MTLLPALQQNVRASRARDVELCHRIATTALWALLAELAAWPKPGLVSHIDNGSHHDMDAAMLERSAVTLRPFFAELARAGSDRAEMCSLRAIGLRAEAAMLEATGGVNTHRGTIFGLGLLCAAAGLAADAADDIVEAPRVLGGIVTRVWGNDIRRGPIPLYSHGSEALRRYGAGGARAEAATGFPSIYNIGLPALRRGRALASDDPAAAAAVQACFALIAGVRDTNLLHRGGMDGARYASETASAFLSDGGVGIKNWRTRAAAVHDGFVTRHLSPGGCADLLAMTLFVDAIETGAMLL